MLLTLSEPIVFSGHKATFDISFHFQQPPTSASSTTPLFYLATTETIASDSDI